MNDNTFGRKLKQARKARGMTQRELATAIGAKHNSISNWENDQNKPDPDVIELICGVLEISPNYLLASSQDDISSVEREMLMKYRAISKRNVPVKEIIDYILDKEYTRCTTPAPTPFPVPLPETVEEGQSPLYNVIPFRNSEQPASAGTGTYLGPEAFETIMVQENDLTKRASFGVPVSGVSMEPQFHDKDILIVAKCDELEVGEIGVFTLAGQAYVKKLGYDELISLNPEYEPIPMDESILLNGRVIGVLEPDWIVG